MGISFSLHRNTLSTESNQYRAVVHSNGTIDYDGIIDQVLLHHSTVTRSDILAVLDSFFLILGNMLRLGFNVTTPGFNCRLTIKGTFNGQTDTFVPGRNSVEISISPGLRLRQIKAEVEVQKQERSDPSPRPLEYTDLNSGELNTVLTPGGLGQLNGHRLKFDPADPTHGVFFTAGGSVTRVSVIAKNDPSELIFLVPAGLTPGDYTLEVRAGASNGTLYTGKLAETLIVG